MADIDFPSPRSLWIRTPDLSHLVRQVALGFAYWFMFDLVFEPDKIAHYIRKGAPIAWDQEIIRLTGAGALGAASAPVVLTLVRRFPIEGPRHWRRVALHGVCSVALSAALILASCLLAAVFLTSEHRPLVQAMSDEVTSNLSLLTFCMIGFVVIAHAQRSKPSVLTSDTTGKPRPIEPRLRRVAVKTRSGILMVETADIDWIETQGNYLALHVGAQTHLIRDTSKHFETLLDPERFVRVHRQAIIAIDRVRSLTPVGSGDAAIRLVTGAELRVSRGHRERLEAWLQCSTACGGAVSEAD